MNRQRQQPALTVVALAVSGSMLLQTAWAKPYTPKPGSKERQAIMDALRVPVTKQVKKKVIFKVDHLKVENGWAFMNCEALTTAGKPVDPEWSSYISALFRKEKNRWKVIRWTFASDVQWPAWQKQYPRAPKAIFPPVG